METCIRIVPLTGGAAAHIMKANEKGEKADMKQTVWYRQPAAEWIEALPVGNGRLGAMLFGDVSHEVLELNEDTLWSGRPESNCEPGRAPYFRQARDLALRGDYAAAQRLIEDNLPGEYGEAYVPLGALTLDFPALDAEEYTRALDLTTATHRVSFRAGGTAYTRECFVSAPDQAVVLRLRAEGLSMLSFALRLDSPLWHTLSCENGVLSLEGQCPSHVEPDYVKSENPVVYDPEKPGIRVHAAVSIRTDGTLTTEGEALRVNGAREAVIVLTARSDFAGAGKDPETSGIPYRENARTDLVSTLSQPYEILYRRHLADYRPLFGRCALELTPDRHELPTDERLARFQTDPSDHGLAALLFDYGRYLLISCSRPGTQAANLQGIWNREIHPPWSSNYTTNINVEMNYWPALACGLPEVCEPLHALIGTLAETGREVARCYHDARGFAVYHNADLWGHCNPVGRRRNGAAHDFWPVAGGWLATHLYQYYRYTGDRDFLRETAYPCLKEAARFFLDLLVEDGAGHLAFVPSTSPENKFLLNGEELGVSRTTTMTTAILRENFTQTLESAMQLGVDGALQAELRKALDRLPPYETGADGRLLEWSEELEEWDPTHRHVSHLFGLYPAKQITPDRTPALAEACRRSLERRSDDGTGWSLGWKLCLWARLRDGDHAHRILRQQLRLTRADKQDAHHMGGGTYPNLFDAHPPFQIDGNFGACAGIAELLLQSADGVIDLLPALPSEWREGSFTGLRTDGGIAVSAAWRDGALLRAELTALRDCVVIVRWGGRKQTLILRAGVPTGCAF